MPIQRFARSAAVLCTLSFFINACGKPPGPAEQNAQLNSLGRVDFRWISANILQPQCVTCHSSSNPSAGIDLSSYAGVMKTAVVPYQPTQSRLYTSTSSGLMPMGGTPLNSSELAAISEWILDGAIEDASSTPSQSPTPSPTATPVPTPSASPIPVPSPSPSPSPTSNATFAWINANILQPKCISCHSGSSARAGINLSSYSEVLLTAVSAGNPNSSALYTAISQGIMPPSGKLNSASIQAVQQWILAGALNN